MTLQIPVGPSKPVERIVARFSPQRVGGPAVFCRALMETLNGGVVVAECRTDAEARRVRNRVAQIANSRIAMNHWFYVATRVTRKDALYVYAWIVHLSEDEMRARYAHWPGERVERMAREDPLCELKRRREATLFDEDAA
jgi:hypothetical protein